MQTVARYLQTKTGSVALRWAQMNHLLIFMPFNGRSNQARPAIMLQFILIDNVLLLPQLHDLQVSWLS